MRKKTSALCAVLVGALMLSMSGCANLEAFIFYNRVQEQEDKLISKDMVWNSEITISSDSEVFVRNDSVFTQSLFLTEGLQQRETGHITQSNETFDYVSYLKDNVNYMVMNGYKTSYAAGNVAEEEAQKAIEEQLGDSALRSCALTNLENGSKSLRVDLDLDAIGSRINVLSDNYIQILDLGGARMKITQYTYTMIVGSDNYIDSELLAIKADILLENGEAAVFTLRSETNVTGRNTIQGIHFPDDLETGYPRLF